MKIIAHKILILILLLAVTSLSSTTEATGPSLEQQNRPTSMPSQWCLDLYQLMKDTHELLVQNKIDYWIQGGTLLGAVRHNGIIPWDDDIDINLQMADEERFKALIPLLENIGYATCTFDLGYKIMSLNVYQIGKLRGSPCIDVFFTIERDGRHYYDPTRDVNWMKRDGGPLYITEEELYPLRAYQFGECTVLGPYDPQPFLTACFGTDWPDRAVRWNHFLKFEESRGTAILTADERQPAQPTGPLYDRVPKTQKIRIYANMIGDLWHYGHNEFLQQASQLSTEVVIGLISDEVATSYKRKPILTLEERIRSAAGCKYVAEIIADSPLAITEEFMKANRLDLVVHGDDFSRDQMQSYFADPLHNRKLRLVSYTTGISTTDLIHRIQNQ